MAPIRIVIAEDHPIVREGLKRLLQTQRDFDVAGEAADGIEAVEQTKALRPDILLLDMSMPRMNGLEALTALAQAKAGTRCIVLTASVGREESMEALRLGARGVVLKESVTEILFTCIRSVVAGGYWVGHERFGDLTLSLRHVERAGARAAVPASQLTPREYHVIAAVVSGATNKDIGERFGLSEQTVKNHLSHIFDKLGVSNRLELGLYAVHHQLLDGAGAGKTTDTGGATGKRGAKGKTAPPTAPRRRPKR